MAQEADRPLDETIKLDLVTIEESIAKLGEGGKLWVGYECHPRLDRGSSFNHLDPASSAG